MAIDDKNAQRDDSPQRNSHDEPTGANPIRPVNAYSNAIDPRKLYPHHFDHLMRNLFAMGEMPEQWRVLDATETRLDEHGMEIEFTIVRQGVDVVWRQRVLVSAGKLLAITTL